MINLNITFALKADQSPELNAEFVAAFARALEAKGYSIQGEAVRAVKSPAMAREKGPNETLALEQSGKKWLKVPSSWIGSREEYFEKVLNGESPMQNDDAGEQGDPLDIFHA